jgi:hypothetical protein
MMIAQYHNKGAVASPDLYVSIIIKVMEHQVALVSVRLPIRHSRHVPRGPRAQGPPTFHPNKINKEVKYEISFDVSSNWCSVFRHNIHLLR